MITRDNLQDLYPLSPMQEGMLYHALLDTKSPAYVEQICYELAGELDQRLFVEAWQHLIQRHPILRTCIVPDKMQRPMQAVLKSRELVYHFEDLQQQDEEAQAVYLAAFKTADVAKGFDLVDEPLTRVAVFKLGEGRHYVIWSFHHIILDGWSTGIVINEIGELYQALWQQRTAQLPDRLPFSRYIQWLETQASDEALSYWQEKLKNYQPKPFFVCYEVDSDAASKKACEHRWVLDTSVSQQFTHQAREHGFTLNSFIQAVWSVIIYQYSDITDMVFGSIVNGRPNQLPGAEEMVGLFINSVPIRVQMDRGESVVSLARRIQQESNAALPHSYLPLTEIPGAAAAVNHLVVLESYPIQASNAGVNVNGQLAVVNVEVNERTHYDLSLIVTPGPQLTFTLQYNNGVYSSAFISRLANQFSTLIQCLAENPEQAISALPILSNAEYQQQVIDWNHPDELPGFKSGLEMTVVDLFQQQVVLHPDQIALRTVSESYTYEELNQRSTLVAKQLLALGLEKEEPVALAMMRSCPMIIAILGIVKAGGVYLGLDLTAPMSRQQAIADDARVRWVISDVSGVGNEGRELKHWSEKVRLLVMDAQRGLALEGDSKQIIPVNSELPVLQPQHLLYISYTSGSTGKPKGVEVTHQNVVRLVHNTRYFDFSQPRVFLHHSPLAFDAASFELWGPILNGNCCAVMTLQQPTLAQFGAALRDLKVDTLWLTAGLFHVMVDEQLDALEGVNDLFAGGDVLSPTHVNRLLAHLPQCNLYNGYGPTENTTFTTVYPIRKPITENLALGYSVPIGHAISGTQVYVLNGIQQPVPIGVSGELYVGGYGVARGYRGMQEQTHERFIPDPFNPDTSDATPHLYRTGDRVVQLTDGTLLFLGRMDRQLKVRGHLVEPAEIEALIASCDKINQAAVIVDHTQDNEPRIVAYVTFKTGIMDVAGSSMADQANWIAQLKAELKEKAPPYLLPQSIFPLDKMPLNSNGKMDRAELSQKLAVSLQQVQTVEGKIAPRNATEEILQDLWRELLDTGDQGLELGVEDDFLQLGGHSLKATQLVARIRKHFKVELPIRDVVEHPTIAGQAKLIEQLQRSSTANLPTTETQQPGLRKRSREQYQRKATELPIDH